MKYSFYRIQNYDNPSTDRSPLSQKLKSITGYYADDYIKPVINEKGKLLDLIIDESKFKNNFAVGAVIIQKIKSDDIKKNEELLSSLIKKYKISDIHFTDIFGRKKILKEKKTNFLKEYVEIVKNIPMQFVSISKRKEILLHELKRQTISDEEIYFVLFWNLFERIALKVEKYSIFTINKEQEYSLQGKKDLEIAAYNLFTDLYSGLEQFFERKPKIYLSVCKHPHFFSKNALLYSSLSDFNAYATNKIQNKIDASVPKQKIIKEYSIMLNMIKDLNKNYSGLPSDKFIELLKCI